MNYEQLPVSSYATSRSLVTSGEKLQENEIQLFVVEGLQLSWSTLGAGLLNEQ